MVIITGTAHKTNGNICGLHWFQMPGLTVLKKFRQTPGIYERRIHGYMRGRQQISGNRKRTTVNKPPAFMKGGYMDK